MPELAPRRLHAFVAVCTTVLPAQQPEPTAKESKPAPDPWRSEPATKTELAKAMQAKEFFERQIRVALPRDVPANAMTFRLGKPMPAGDSASETTFAVDLK